MTSNLQEKLKKIQTRFFGGGFLTKTEIDKLREGATKPFKSKIIKKND